MESIRSIFALVLMAGSALLAVACGDTYNPSSPTTPSGGAVSLAAKADKVDVCHRAGNGGFQRISVNSNALPAHLAHGDLVVGVDADESCAPSTGNTPPVAVDDPFGLDPQDSGTWPFDQSGDLSLHATDADGDDLTFSIVPGSFVPAQLDQFGNGVLFFNFDSATGAWDLLCIGGDGSADPFGSTVGSFQWIANDGQADSNVATQYFNCFV